MTAPGRPAGIVTAGAVPESTGQPTTTGPAPQAYRLTSLERRLLAITAVCEGRVSHVR